MSAISFSEFRPTILFLAKFLALYLAGNLVYGLYVTSYNPRTDPATRIVTENTAMVLGVCGWDVSIQDHSRKPNTMIMRGGKEVISVYEGCNGINTAIIFIAFVVAFGPVSKRMLWFLPLGLVIIHLVNLGRIGLLFYVVEYMPDYLYFTHKYLFTAILYGVIFLLWVWWVKRFSFRHAAA